ncbi:MAG: hypothetical protein O7G85_17190, partial [Planctomycetota bacterium]|nr:hypothetical protein [Planctomycetota bacterium]
MLAAFFEMVLEAEEADVNEWVMNCLPSYAWRTFESEDEAKRWLNEYQDLPSEAVALAKMEDWIDDLALMVKAGDPPGPELNQLVEKGFHWPRHAALQAAAQRKGLPDLILKVLKHESVTEHAAFIIADWLGRIDPQRFPSTEIKNLVADLNKREIPAGKRQTELHVRTIDSDPLKKWILHPPLDVSLPEAGAGLLVVLPGGDGSIDFAPFVQDTIRSAAGPDFVILQMIAPPITPMFKNAMVWPLAHLPDARIPFTMEPVILAAVNVARIEHRIDPNRIWVMGWSSGGPAAYELVLMPDSPFSGALVAMSIFMPNLLSPLNGAKDKSFYVLHSPQDFIAMRFPEAASSQLHEAGARTTLVEYEGGHGWHGDVATKIRAAITWLETPDQARHP